MLHKVPFTFVSSFSTNKSNLQIIFRHFCPSSNVSHHLLLCRVLPLTSHILWTTLNLLSYHVPHCGLPCNPCPSVLAGAEGYRQRCFWSDDYLIWYEITVTLRHLISSIPSLKLHGGRLRLKHLLGKKHIKHVIMYIFPTGFYSNSLFSTLRKSREFAGGRWVPVALP